MELALMIPVIVILTVSIWAINRKKWRKDKRVILYKMLMSKGCIHCHGKLVSGDFSLNHLIVECEICDAEYELEPVLHLAWER